MRKKYYLGIVLLSVLLGAFYYYGRSIWHPYYSR